MLRSTVSSFLTLVVIGSLGGPVWAACPKGDLDGDCEVDFDRGEVRRNGAAIDISAQEFRLLSTFVHCRGRVMSRDKLIDAAWGPDTFVTDRVVDTHVWNLRKKVEPVPAEPRYIRSVRGMGYRFEG